jgi:RNA polymerase sigma-70 factor, ECF subfamily
MSHHFLPARLIPSNFREVGMSGIDASDEPGSNTHSAHPAAAKSHARRATADRASKLWVESLQPGNTRRSETVARLYEQLRRIAYHELSRRRNQLGSIQGPEFDDLAEQAANDALVNILERLDTFQGLSRFTTWAYKFVMYEVSTKVARHSWRQQPLNRQAVAFEQLPDRFAPRPDGQVEQQEQLKALSLAIGQLTDRQREVFIAIALNEVPIDEVAIQLGSNRNAIYKNLFDARRSLRARMAAAGHPVLAEDAA